MKPFKPLASWLGIALLLLVPASACAQSETPRAPLATFDYDAEAPLDIREVGTEDRGSYTVVDFTYASPAGGRVPALLYEPKGEGPFAGLILMHGMPGSRKNSAFLAKAYVLWVGDGGLAAHVTGSDDANGGFQRLPAEQRAAWLRAMEPIEPIRFVGMTAPSALFFQAGRNDQLIPTEDAERYHAAGSEPKHIQWYDAGHGLNAAAFRDQALWLEERIGIDAAKGWP